MSQEFVTVVGAGLAGSEAAFQLAKRGIPVHLLDMKPAKLSPAHSQPLFAELVCSNSLRSEKWETGSGLLKAELRFLGSLIMEAADACRLPAGNALAVDREAFPRYVTARLKDCPLIQIEEKRIENYTELGNAYRIIATGPLTDLPLLNSLKALLGETELFFFDAAAPLIEYDSLDMSKIFRASRYQEGEEGDYLNCPLTKEEYLRFYEALMTAEKAAIRDFDHARLFSGCQPVEELAAEGEDTLRFGPMKPVGLIDPHTGKEAYAVVQLRRDNFQNSIWNMVGFQNRLKFPEQERVFRLIPGLEEARFARFGVMHRNAFINSPQCLDSRYRCKMDSKLAIAGQLSGVEGYLESTASGLWAALKIAEELGAEAPNPAFQTRKTILGGLAAYISQPPTRDFQPMKANFSLLDPLSREEIKSLRKKYEIHGRSRRERRLLYSLRSLEALGFSTDSIRQLVFQEAK